MPPFDREGALKSAEKALKLGKIDAAIAEYLKIVEAQPRDWNSANALGDLYVRAGQTEKGISHYVRIADHLETEGFYPKAAALYKKILKVKPGEESALLQLARSPRARACSPMPSSTSTSWPTGARPVETRRAPPSSPFAWGRWTPTTSTRDS